MRCKDCKIPTCPARDTSTAGEKVCPFTVCNHSRDQLKTLPEFNWWHYRYDAAKDILCALLTNNEGYHGDSENQLFVSQSIGLADELIRQLRQSSQW